ncbi:33331_t:CDS:2, partial [Gigaspora margarita]
FDKGFKLQKLNIIQALNQTFQNMYRYHDKYWNKMMQELISNSNEKCFIKDIIDKNLSLNHPLETIYDDLIVTTSSGLNIVKLTIML